MKIPPRGTAAEKEGAVVLGACSQCARDSYSVNRRDPLPCMDNETKTEKIVSSLPGEIDR